MGSSSNGLKLVPSRCGGSGKPEAQTVLERLAANYGGGQSRQHGVARAGRAHYADVERRDVIGTVRQHG